MTDIALLEELPLHCQETDFMESLTGYDRYRSIRRTAFALSILQGLHEICLKVYPDLSMSQNLYSSPENTMVFYYLRKGPVLAQHPTNKTNVAISNSRILWNSGLIIVITFYAKVK